jgi:hypothetical protein
MCVIHPARDATDPPIRDRLDPLARVTVGNVAGLGWAERSLKKRPCGGRGILIDW